MVSDGSIRRCWKKDELEINEWREIDFDEIMSGDLIKLESSDRFIIAVTQTGAIKQVPDTETYFNSVRFAYLYNDPSVEESIDILETRWEH